MADTTTALLLEHTPINSINAHLTTELLRLGRGRAKGIHWRNSETLSVSTTLGMWEYTTDGSERHITTFDWNGIYSRCPILYSPNGKLIAADADNLIYIWDVEQKQTHFIFRNTIDPERSFYELAFSPNGQFLGAVSYYGTCIWDVRTGTKIAALKTENGASARIGFTPENDGLVVMSTRADLIDLTSGCSVATYETSNLRELIAHVPPNDSLLRVILRTFSGISDMEGGIVISPDSRFVLYNQGSELIVWDTLMQDARMTYLANSVPIIMPVFSPDCRWLAFIDLTARSLYLCDVEARTCTPLDELSGPSLESLVFSPGSDFLIGTDFADTLHRWDLNSGRQAQTIVNAGYKVLAFNSDWSFLAAQRRDNTINLIDLATGAQYAFEQGHSLAVTKLVTHPGSTLITSAGLDREVRLWDVPLTRQVRSVHISGGGDHPFFLLSADGRLLASSDTTKYRIGEMWAIDLVTGEELLPGQVLIPECFNQETTHIAIRNYEDHKFTLDAIDLSHRQRQRLYQFDAQTHGYLSLDWRFVTVRMPDQKHTQVREVYTNKVIVDIAHGQLCDRLGQFSTDNTKWMMVFVGDQSNLYVACVWDLQSRTELVRYTSEAYIGPVALSPNGQTLFIAHAKSARLLDVATGQIRAELDAQEPYPVIFNKDGSLCALGSNGSGSSIQVWDVESGRLVAVLKGHVGGIRTLAFNDDETMLISGAEDGTIRVWGIPRGD